MKSFVTLLAASLFALNMAQAQDKKQQKKAAVTAARATVAADKADLKQNKAKREADKALLDEPALNADRKAHRRKQVRLLKDQVKKDVKFIKEKPEAANTASHNRMMEPVCLRLLTPLAPASAAGRA